MQPSDNKQLDILICIVPKIDPMAPTVGPALLKAHLLEAGFSCEVFDVNVKLYNHLLKKNQADSLFFGNDSIFSAIDGAVPPAFEEFCIENMDFLLKTVDHIRAKNPKFVGLSLLTKYSLSLGYKMAQLIREHLPQIKIVWGGPNVENQIVPWQERGLVDHYIAGDGEFSLVELLKGNLKAPGIDTDEVNQVSDLDKVLIPNYDDIDWSEYRPDNDFDNIIYITGSRGCVRRCTFCNVYQLWPKFRQRSTRRILCEIHYLRIKYGRSTFKFTDSLINGSIKAYRELLMALAEYKKIYPEFCWISQWIIRPKEFSPEEDFKLLKESGCVWLEIGLESFSQHIRYHMGKKFTDEDVDWCFDMLQKYKIPASFLMIAGYLTETEEDHQYTLNKIHELYGKGYLTSRNADGHILVHLCYTSTLMLFKDIPMWDMVKDEVIYNGPFDWEYRGSTLPLRLKRFNEITALIEKYKSFVGGEMAWQIARALREQNQVQQNSGLRRHL